MHRPRQKRLVSADSGCSADVTAGGGRNIRAKATSPVIPSARLLPKAGYAHVAVTMGLAAL
jgi:hypothetical protein